MTSSICRQSGGREIENVEKRGPRDLGCHGLQRIWSLLRSRSSPNPNLSVPFFHTSSLASPRRRVILSVFAWDFYVLVMITFTALNYVQVSRILICDIIWLVHSNFNFYRMFPKGHVHSNLCRSAKVF